ncbi:Protein Y57G11C.20 [Aphelenchoides avenae]|nr:Protein Y57G11C.20 [Aphelenchus avenae]
MEFNATWKVGLSNIIYPYSWPNLGTDSQQFIEVTWHTGVTTRIPVRSASYKTAVDLENALAASLKSGSDALCKVSTEVVPKKRRRRGILDDTSDEDLSQVIKDITGKTPEEHDAEFTKIHTRIRNLKKEKEELETKNNQDIAALEQRIEDLRTTTAGDNTKKDEDIAQLKTQLLQMSTSAESTKIAYDAKIESQNETVRDLKTMLDNAVEFAKKSQKDARAQSDLHDGRLRLLEEKIKFLERVSGKDALPTPEIIVPEGCENATGAPYDHLHEYIHFHYDADSERFVLKLNLSKVVQVRMTEQLKYMLGFDEEVFSTDRTVAKYMPDLHGDIHSLYIYAPQLVEPTLVGDELVPLLRIARVKGSPGEMVEDTFLTPQYHKVLAKQLSEVSVHIRTRTGRLVPFNWGECILVLHFVKTSLF